MKIGRCQVISLNETILLYNDIVSCALFVLFYPMPSAPVFIAIYIKEEMAYGTLNLISSWNISYIFPLLMTMDKLNYILHNLPRFMYELLICIHKYNSNMKRWHKTTCYMSSKIQWGQTIMKQHQNTLLFQNSNCHYLALNFPSVASDKPFTLFNISWYIIDVFWSQLPIPIQPM